MSGQVAVNKASAAALRWYASGTPAHQHFVIGFLKGEIDDLIGATAIPALLPAQREVITSRDGAPLAVRYMADHTGVNLRSVWLRGVNIIGLLSDDVHDVLEQLAREDHARQPVEEGAEVPA